MKKIVLSILFASTVLAGSVYADSGLGNFTAKLGPAVDFSSWINHYGGKAVVNIVMTEGLASSSVPVTFSKGSRLNDLVYKISSIKNLNIVSTDGKNAHMKFGFVIKDGNNKNLYSCSIDKPSYELKMSDNIQLHIRSLHTNDCYLTKS
jgi:hypothetical protein